jgi:hypothetical protein
MPDHVTEKEPDSLHNWIESMSGVVCADVSTEFCIREKSEKHTSFSFCPFPTCPKQSIPGVHLSKNVEAAPLTTIIGCVCHEFRASDNGLSILTFPSSPRCAFLRNQSNPSIAAAYNYKQKIAAQLQEIFVTRSGSVDQTIERA